MILEMFASLLATVLKGFRQELTPMLRDLEMMDTQSVEEAIPALAALVREYRKQAAKVANQFMADAAAEAGGQALLPPVEGYPDRAVYQVLVEARSLEEITGALERHVRTAARRQVVRTVPAPVVDPASETNPDGSAISESDDGVLQGVPGEGFSTAPVEYPEQDSRPVYPTGWARVLTGKDNCPFCIMLASRGPVYSSAHHAGSRSAKDWAGQAAGWANSYHDHCDCLVVPVYDPENWAGKDQAEALYRIYEKVTRQEASGGKNVGEGNDKLKAWSDYLKDLDEQGRELKYPALAPDKEPLAREVDAELDRALSMTATAYTSEPGFKSVWPVTDEPEPREKEFLKRFEKNGYSAEWIPNNKVIDGIGKLPANDFFWVEKKRQASELKSSKNNYGTISNRIKKAVLSAKTHPRPVTKDVFVIDLGEHRMDDKLRMQLSKYNQRNQRNQIRELWVMHGDGKTFEEIRLQ